MRSPHLTLAWYEWTCEKCFTRCFHSSRWHPRIKTDLPVEYLRFGLFATPKPRPSAALCHDRVALSATLRSAHQAAHLSEAGSISLVKVSRAILLRTCGSSIDSAPCHGAGTITPVLAPSGDKNIAPIIFFPNTDDAATLSGPHHRRQALHGHIYLFVYLVRTLIMFCPPCSPSSCATVLSRVFRRRIVQARHAVDYSHRVVAQSFRPEQWGYKGG